MARGGGLARGAARSSRRRGVLPELLLALLAVSALGYVAIDQRLVSLPGLEQAGRTGAAPDTVSYRFTLCAGAGGTCVVDGDTIRIEGQAIRIADIDTPEVRNFSCPQEKALGDRATAGMLALVNAGGFAMAPWGGRDEDQYGRKLRVLMRDGQSLGMMLVAQGLARPWDGARRSWCG